MKKLLFAASVALVLAGCTAKIDTSSPEAYSKSVRAVMEDMTPEKKVEFKNALLALAFDTADPGEGFMSGADPTAPIFAAAGDKIKGKTGDQVIRAGYEARIALLDKAIAEDASAIQRVNAEREKYKAVFDNIHIDGARYYVSDNGYIEQPTISFKVTNNSKIPLARIYLHGILSSPGRSIPWVSDDINYAFSGGLEPGETQHLDLEPNMFGGWKADATYSKRPDLNLNLTVVNVEDASGQSLLQGDPGDVKAKQTDAAAKQKMRDELKAKLDKL